MRVGNAAAEQFQLDVYGETINTLHRAREAGLVATPDRTDWRVAAKLLEFLESRWQQPDDGVWEVRGERKHFTYSKVMAWAAVDRLIRLAERFHLQTDLGRWKAMRRTIHREVCEKGYHPGVGAFSQSYGSEALDASILRLPLVGFLPPDDPRVVSTLAAVEWKRLRDGFVRRYLTDEAGAADGLSGREGAFLPCTFWLVDNYHLVGRHDEAHAVSERLLNLRSDLGLLSEEYDPQNRRLVGNFPQAFSHVALVNTALRLRS